MQEQHLLHYVWYKSGSIQSQDNLSPTVGCEGNTRRGNLLVVPGTYAFLLRSLFWGCPPVLLAASSIWKSLVCQVPPNCHCHKNKHSYIDPTCSLHREK